MATPMSQPAQVEARANILVVEDSSVFREMQGLFDVVARAKPFTLARELKSPVDVSSVNLAIHPVEYRHEAKVGAETRTVTVRSPEARRARIARRVGSARAAKVVLSWSVATGIAGPLYLTQRLNTTEDRRCQVRTAQGCVRFRQMGCPREWTTRMARHRPRLRAQWFPGPAPVQGNC